MIDIEERHLQQLRDSLIAIQEAAKTVSRHTRDLVGEDLDAARREALLMKRIVQKWADEWR